MDAFYALLSQAYARVATVSAHTFFDAGSTFSLASLACAALLAGGLAASRRLRRGRRLRSRTLWAAVKPRGLRSPSGKADLGFLLFNTFSAGGLITWALLSQATVTRWSEAWLARYLGPVGGTYLHGAPAAALLTGTTFLAYELAYWVDHWLSHHVPWLWEIHKVHHTAQSLTPATNFRVHPLETLKFYNIAALLTGVAVALVDRCAGAHVDGLKLFGADAASVAFMFTVGHLQHSHVWISTRGPLGRLLMSPAHHQIHHSTDPRHFGRNLGSALAVFDWMFGTLYIPAVRREPLRFGVEGAGEQAHTVTGALVTPVRRAVAVLVGRLA